MAYQNKATVTAFGAIIKKATMPETVEEAKAEHRNTLHELIDQYKKEVSEGKMPGIRNAKDLIEVMKLDLLLMGEATERTDTTADTIHLTRLEGIFNTEDSKVLEMLDGILEGIDSQNDDLDNKPAKEQYRVSDYIDYDPEQYVAELSEENESKEE